MAESLQEFREWAVKKGQVSNPTTNPEGLYTGECVSLIQQYLWRVFNIPYAARGHAKDFVPPTFNRLPVNTKLKPGDILRYRPTQIFIYGHIGMIDDDGMFLDQNGVAFKRVARSKVPYSGYEALFRPTKPFNVKKPKENTEMPIIDSTNSYNVYRKFVRLAHRRDLPREEFRKKFVGKTDGAMLNDILKNKVTDVTLDFMQTAKKVTKDL